jgi:hypothetical protein
LKVSPLKNLNLVIEDNPNSFPEYLELEACLFNWGDSYDAKVPTYLSLPIPPSLPLT